MAFDSANKRYSALGIGLDFMRVRPEPDGTIDTTDRLHFLPLVNVIAAGAPSSSGDTLYPYFPYIATWSMRKFRFFSKRG